MGSYEWMELQTLTDEIAASRSRLAAARASRDIGRVKALEEEITAAEGRRDRLLKHITTNLVGTPGNRLPVDKPPASANGAEGENEEPEEQPVEEVDAATPPAIEPGPAAAADGSSFPQSADATIATTGVASPAPAVQAASVEGGSMAWNQLTPGDIERAKHELGVRRAEMLARHAEELQALEGDQAQLDALEQAIAAFAQKFARGGAKAENERERRQGD